MAQEFCYEIQLLITTSLPTSRVVDEKTRTIWRVEGFMDIMPALLERVRFLGLGQVSIAKFLYSQRTYNFNAECRLISVDLPTPVFPQTNIRNALTPLADNSVP